MAGPGEPEGGMIVHRYLSKLTALLLAAVLALGLSVSALAAVPVEGDSTGTTGTFDDPGSVDPGPVDPGTSHDDDSDNQVTFKCDTGYTLEAQSGTSAKKDGSVVVTLSTVKLPASKIPDVIPQDEYYQITGWAILSGDTLQEIDLEDYRFTRSNTDVYAICQDVWPVFDDMKADRTDWFYQYVRDLTVNGVVNGCPGNVYNPNGTVTWGEALKLILLAAGYPVQEPVDSHWASGYLAAAIADGLVEPGAITDLNDTVTRLEYCTVAARAMELEPSEAESPFVDTGDSLMVALYEAGIVEGTFGTTGREFMPDNSIHRSEISAVIWRIYNYMAEI